MPHLKERVECLMFCKKFNETLFNTDQLLRTLEKAIEEIQNNAPLKRVLELILALGNYMNGATQRGQADGFELEILAKIKDVKSIDNHTNLLNYVIRVYCRIHEEQAGQNGALCSLPESILLRQAEGVSFIDVEADLNKLQHQLQTLIKEADIVYNNAEPDVVQPFKDHMEEFFETADEMLKRQFTKVASTRESFDDVLKYYAVKENTGQVLPDAFFGVWVQFVEDCRNSWKREQKYIAREMFEKVQAKKRERLRTARRKKSIVEDPSSLKNKFEIMKKRNDNGPKNTVKMLRSQSTSSIETTSGEATPPGTLSGKPPVMEQQQQQQQQQPQQQQQRQRLSSSSSDTSRRRRRAASDVRNSTDQIQAALAIQSDEPEGRQESMAQRMERRRRSKPSAPGDVAETVPYSDIQNRIQQREQLVVGHDDEAHNHGQSNDADRQFSTSQLLQDTPTTEQRSRRRYSVDSAPDETQQMMQAKTAQVMVAQNANTPRRRRQGRDENRPMSPAENISNNNHNGLTRSRSSEQSVGINQLAQGKPPRDRSPIVQSNPNYIPMQQLTNMAFRQRSQQSSSDMSSPEVHNMSGGVSPTDVFLPNQPRQNGSRTDGDPQTTSQFRDVLRSRRSRATSEDNGSRQPMFVRSESEGSLSARAREYPNRH